jgi:uncharacterized protein (UPF0276 family)
MRTAHNVHHVAAIVDEIHDRFRKPLVACIPVTQYAMLPTEAIRKKQRIQTLRMCRGCHQLKRSVQNILLGTLEYGCVIPAASNLHRLPLQTSNQRRLVQSVVRVQLRV